MTTAVLAEPAVRTVPGWWQRWPDWVGSLAGAWSLAYGALGLYWALGGAGFPFANARTEHWMSIIGGVRAESGGRAITVLGLAGAVVAVAMSRSWEEGHARTVSLGFGWGTCVTLLLVIPDVRVLMLLGYLPALIINRSFDAIEWPMLHQGFCILGGFAWGAATLAYQRRTRRARQPEGRTAAGVVWATPTAAARWGRWATYAAVLLPLPYAATRVAWAFGFPLGLSGSDEASLAIDPSVRVNVLSLGGMPLVGALLTLGLVRRWGEVFPGWLPVLAGRRVPPALAIVPASVASAVLITGGLAIWRMVIAEGIGDSAGWGAVVPGLVFLPWGIALGLATLAYYYRRREQSMVLPGHHAAQ